jgi:tetratricopeptide (TPR) repeat protein
LQLGQRAVDLFRSLRDDIWLARTLITLGDQHLVAGEVAAAENLYLAALAISRAQEDVWALANLANRLGMVADASGDRDCARSCFAEGRKLFRRDGEVLARANETANLGWVEVQAGNLDRAAALVFEAVETLVQLQALGYRSLPSTLDTPAHIQLGRGRAAEAARSLGVREAILARPGKERSPGLRRESRSARQR